MVDKQVHLIRNFVSLLIVCSMLFSELWTGGIAMATEKVSLNPVAGLDNRDSFPRGCVDCHVVLPEEQRDVRISTIMKNLAERVDPRLQARLAKGATGKAGLHGRHPALLSDSLEIPAICQNCHRADSATVPPFAEMMHLIHLADSEDNHYISLFNGDCSFCHKFDPYAGTFSVPSHTE